VNRGADRRRAAAAVTVTRWLAEVAFPAVEPVEMAVQQSIVIEVVRRDDDVADVPQDVWVAFWRFYPRRIRGPA
jgi:hypothetical protein